MRTPRVRFSLRTMMAAVAVVAVFLIPTRRTAVWLSEYVARNLRARGTFLLIAERQALKEEMAAGTKASWYHAQIRKNYERAAARPWEYVRPFGDDWVEKPSPPNTFLRGATNRGSKR